MKLHVLGQSYAPTLSHHPADAFPGKIWRFCAMMKSMGHTVIHYGVEGSNPPCDECVTIVLQSELDKLLPNKDFSKEAATKALYDVASPWWQYYNKQAYEPIKARISMGEVVLYMGGNTQFALAKHLGDSYRHVEPSIGYDGPFAPFCVFSSYAHMHRMYGLFRQSTARIHDAVIPHAYNLDEFEFSPTADDYLLFLGRAMYTKGLGIAISTAMNLQCRLLIAGHGITSITNSEIQTFEGGRFPINKNVEFIGYLTPDKRAGVLRKAKALMMPTLYFEPFGNVAIEAMLSGTPVISTDWGAFTETVEHGVTGLRCRTMPEFIEAVQKVKYINREDCRAHAASKYSMDVIKHRHDAYLRALPPPVQGQWLLNVK